MTAVLNIVFAAIAGIAILGALFYGGRAVIRRGQSNGTSYNVGRLESRRAVQIDLIRALAAIVVALIFLGAFGLTPQPIEPLISPTEPVLLEATDMPTEPSATIAPTDLPAPEQSTPTSTQPEPTELPETSEPAPTNTSEPVVNTAVVSSGVGVWLRGTPSTTGEQLEWLLDGTVLTLLDGQETADALLWQQVQTETELIGWVASDFILISE